MINGFDYCPRGYIEGGYYFFTRPSTAGIIRVRVLFEGGSYMRKYGRKKRGSTLNNLIHEVKKLWAKFQKRLQCVGPTLTRKFSRKSRRVSRRRLIPFQYYKRRNKRDLDSVEEEEDFSLKTVEDCFDDVPKPRFGLGSIFL